MFKGRKKIYKAVLQAERDNPKDISYRGQGLSNEYRPVLARGLIGWFETRHAKKILELYKNRIQTEDP